MTYEKAVVYARYSSHNQTEQSIEGQLAAAHKYANEHNYIIVNEYCDRAKTGTNDNREAFQQMLRDTSKKEFTVIIVWKVDRFGRNREEITFNKYRCKKNGVRVEYIAENITDGPEGVILESVLEGMAEYYSLQLSQNVKRGLLESAKKHKVIGGRPLLGYRTAPDDTYEIDPETAPVVRIIFEKYSEGMTIAELLCYLNGHGYRNNGREFKKDAIPRILHNEKYKGIYIYKDIIRDEGGMPAIISNELFDKVQERLNINRRKPSRAWNYSDYLLSDKLFCGHCGESMIGKSGHGEQKVKYHYYVCSGRLKHSGCTKKPHRKEPLEEYVVSNLTKIVCNENINHIIELVWNYYLAQKQETDEIRQLEKQLSKVKSYMANIIKGVEDGMPYDLVKARLEELEAQGKTIAQTIANSRLQQGFQLTRAHIELFLKQFINMDYTDRKCQKRLIDTFVNGIYLYDDKLVITFNYSGDNNTVTLKDIKKANTLEPNEKVRMCLLNQGMSDNVRTFLFRNAVIIELNLNRMIVN